MQLLPIQLLSAAFLALATAGRQLGARQGLSSLLITIQGLATFIACFIAQETLVLQTTNQLTLATWYPFQGQVLFALSFTKPQVVMMLVILMISSVVHLQALNQLAEDPHRQRFMAWLTLFTLSMLWLVLSQDLLSLLLGWEGIGLASFLLISFWFTRQEAVVKAIKAFLMNRIGDLFLLLAIWLTFRLTGTLQQTLLNGLLPQLHPIQLDGLGVLFLIAVAAKSGQFGLHTWLPTSMEGPTPVSALLHAATLVTAGSQLILFLYPLYHHTWLVAWLGSLSALQGASMAWWQTDLKRMIAQSTISQIGQTLAASGLGEPMLALFHLVNHAFFKAQLFLSAGNVIHAVQDDQDLRSMGGLALLLPMTLAGSWIASAALLALPFTSGFQSKELILFHSHATFLHGFLTLAACFTWGYTVKQLTFVYWTRPQSNRVLGAQDHLMLLAQGMSMASLLSGQLGQSLLLQPMLKEASDSGSHPLAWQEGQIVLLAAPFAYYTRFWFGHQHPLRVSAWRWFPLSTWLDQGFFRHLQWLSTGQQLAARWDQAIQLHLLHALSWMLLATLALIIW